jgi:hypothetical protein
MSIFPVARWQSARSIIKWLCIHERWYSKVAIIFSTAARYRRATVGRSHDDANPVHAVAVRSHSGFVESPLIIALLTSNRS